jgi:hypothetical protein
MQEAWNALFIRVPKLLVSHNCQRRDFMCIGQYYIIQYLFKLQLLLQTILIIIAQKYRPPKGER